MKVCGPSFFSLRTIVWMFEKYYLNNKEQCSSGIDFLYFDMLLKKHGGKRNGGKRNGGNVLFSMPADRS